MKRLGRRKFVQGAAAGTAAAAVAFPYVARGAKPYDGQVLSVFSYAGAFESTVRDHLVARFEESTGARVKLDVGWWDMLPKLKASPPGQPVYDAVITDPTQGFPSIKEGLFEKFDPANIPNAKLNHGPMQENWVQKDNWGVNLSGSMMVMAFNTEVSSAVPSHWHQLLDPALEGKLSFYNALYMSLYTFAQMKAGLEGRPGEGRAELEKDFDGVLKFCAEHRDVVRVWWTSSGDFVGKLLQKEISGGVCHSSAAFPAEDDGKPVKSVIPDEGTANVHLFWAIPAGTKVKRLAEEWINETFSTAFQTKWGAVGKIPVTNLEAAPLAAKENAFYGRFLPTSKEDWDKVAFYPYDVYFDGDNWERANDFWDREVLRKS